MPLPLARECLPLLEGGRVLLGLSGGRDSVALLHVLAELGVDLCACHVNHGIRGAEADADAAFCAELCARLGVPFCCESADVPALARRCRVSLETAGRAVRRRVLAEQARARGCASVALAHHADDQAETALFRLARGSAGWRGMLPLRRERGLWWLRPLLGCRRAELTAWLTARGLRWREDATNAQDDAARNRLRHDVLPRLSAALGRDAVPLIARSARLQAEGAQALAEALAALPLEDPQGRLYLPFLAGRSVAFRKAVLHDYVTRRGVPEVSEKMVLALEAMLDPQAQAHALCLPGGWTARRRHRRLELLPPAGALAVGSEDDGLREPRDLSGAEFPEADGQEAPGSERGSWGSRRPGGAA